MGFRFGKSIRLGKFIRINLSQSGVGASIGVGGFRIGTGPSGTRVSAGLPGTGLRYTQQLFSNSKTSKSKTTKTKAVEAAPERPSPGFFASRTEKTLHKGLEALDNGRSTDALNFFLEIAADEPAAAILAAHLLMPLLNRHAQAITLLENVMQSDTEFPTPLMTKYLSNAHLGLPITPELVVDVPLDSFTAVLLLVELYQTNGRLSEAIGLLEEVADVASEPAITLSLCDLYAAQGAWEGVIERASQVVVMDDLTLALAILYGRAMQAQNLHDAAMTIFTDALRKKSGRLPHLLREAMYWRAISYEAKNKKSQANKAFQEIYAQEPGFRDVKKRLGLN